MKKGLLNTKRLIIGPRIINGLTISRIILGLPAIIALTYKANTIFIVIMLIGSLTDFLDGYYARKYNYQSIFGAKLDPLADKILLLGPMIWLVHENLIPLWAVWLLITRELIITNWRSEKATGGPASIQGKYKTAIQFISIILIFWPQDWGSRFYIYLLNKIGYIGFWISFILTFTSAIKYMINQKEFDLN